MVITDGSQDSEIRSIYHICGIQSASESCFQHHHIHFLFQEIQECHGTDDLEFRWVLLPIHLHVFRTFLDDPR